VSGPGPVPPHSAELRGHGGRAAPGVLSAAGAPRPGIGFPGISFTAGFVPYPCSVVPPGWFLPCPSAFVLPLPGGLMISPCSGCPSGGPPIPSTVPPPRLRLLSGPPFRCSHPRTRTHLRARNRPGPGRGPELRRIREATHRSGGRHPCTGVGEAGRMGTAHPISSRSPFLALTFSRDRRPCLEPRPWLNQAQMQVGRGFNSTE